MIYFLYGVSKDKDKKTVSCLCLKEDSGKIIDSKIIKETFNLNENIKNKWPWAKTGEGHFYIGKSEIPDILIPYIKVVQESLDSENSQKEDSHKAEDYKEELRIAIKFVQTFLKFSENPEMVKEFKEFEDFKIKYGLNDYLIEDWLIDMEELIEQSIN